MSRFSIGVKHLVGALFVPLSSLFCINVQCALIGKWFDLSVNKRSSLVGGSSKRYCDGLNAARLYCIAQCWVLCPRQSLRLRSPVHTSRRATLNSSTHDNALHFNAIINNNRNHSQRSASNCARPVSLQSNRLAAIWSEAARPCLPLAMKCSD